MSETTYNVITPENGVPVKAWTKGVPLEDAARKQTPQCRAAPVRLQVDRRDAGRALGHRRDRRQRDPDARARSFRPQSAWTSVAA